MELVKHAHKVPSITLCLEPAPICVLAIRYILMVLVNVHKDLALLTDNANKLNALLIYSLISEVATLVHLVQLLLPINLDVYVYQTTFSSLPLLHVYYPPLHLQITGDQTLKAVSIQTLKAVSIQTLKAVSIQTLKAVSIQTQVLQILIPEAHQ